MPRPSNLDEQMMRRALRLAQRGQGRVEPNPMVGCVIARGAQVIGEGWHRRFGGPHAEPDALAACARSPRGATLYVTLEPCCHAGKTPACVEAVLRAGIGRVLAATRDPNPLVAGRGLRKLRAAGVGVECGVLAAEAKWLNAPYFKCVAQQRPWVILKWAQSVDGKIATRTGDSKWISDERARAHTHRTRGRVDAIIVGAETAGSDDPMLTARIGRPRRLATRIVLDTHLRISSNAALVRTAREVPTWIVCGGRAPCVRARRLEQHGCRVIRVRSTQRGLSLASVLDRFGAAGMTNVLVEGGGRLLGRFVDERLADELHVYIAPRLIGGQQAVSALRGVGPARVRDALPLTESLRMQKLGAGWFLSARLPRSD